MENNIQSSVASATNTHPSFPLVQDAHAKKNSSAKKALFISFVVFLILSFICTGVIGITTARQEFIKATEKTYTSFELYDKSIDNLVEHILASFQDDPRKAGYDSYKEYVSKGKNFLEDQKNSQKELETELKRLHNAVFMFFSKDYQKTIRDYIEKSDEIVDLATSSLEWMDILESILVKEYVKLYMEHQQLVFMFGYSDLDKYVKSMEGEMMPKLRKIISDFESKSTRLKDENYKNISNLFLRDMYSMEKYFAHNIEAAKAGRAENVKKIFGDNYNNYLDSTREFKSEYDKQRGNIKSKVEEVRESLTNLQNRVNQEYAAVRGH